MDQPDQGIQPMSQSEAATEIENLLTDDGGEVEAQAETEEVSTESTDESVEETTEETTAETTEEETEDEPDETEESEESEDEEAEKEEVSEEQEQDSIETLADLAEALDTPLEEVLANLKTTVKVNGEELSVTLQEALAGYQKDAYFRQETGELAEEKRSFQTASTEARQQIEEQMIQLGQYIESAEQMFVQPPDESLMEHLKQTDPQRYLLAKSEYEEKTSQLNQLKRAAADQYVQNKTALDQQNQEARNQQFEKAGEELHRRIPDWDGKLKTSVDDYLTGEAYGYSAVELSHVDDPRLVQLAHKAMLYDKSQEAAKVVTKKVKTLPKVQPKAPQGKISPKSNAMAQAKARLKKSGSMEDAAALVEQLL